MKISEIFESIQGEGPWIGYPTVFVRLHGCNLNCSFCDTRYSKEGGYTEYDPRELANSILERRSNFIVFTGGEPTLQMDELKITIGAIRKGDPLKSIAIETNGTQEFDSTLFDVVVVSPKSMAVVARWSSVPNVYMKFLASDEHDVENVRRQMGMNIFSNVPYIMPIGVDAEGIKSTSKVLVNSIIANGLDVILSPRLHVLMGVR